MVTAVTKKVVWCYYEVNGARRVRSRLRSYSESSDLGNFMVWPMIVIIMMMIMIIIV